MPKNYNGNRIGLDIFNIINNTWRYICKHPMAALTYCVMLSSLNAKAESLVENEDGLVAYYPFDGGALDASGNGFHGRGYDVEYVEDRHGNANSAVRFNGSTHILGEAIRGDLSFPSQERSIIFFFKPEVNLLPDGRDRRGFFLGYGGRPINEAQPEGESFLIALNNCGVKSKLNSYEIQSHYDTKRIDYVDDHMNGSRSDWNHFGMTSSYLYGTSIYINGIAVSTDKNLFIDNTVVKGSQFAIGAAIQPYGRDPYTNPCIGGFEGDMDDLRIYQKVLTASDMNLIANGNETQLSHNYYDDDFDEYTAKPEPTIGKPIAALIGAASGVVAVFSIFAVSTCIYRRKVMRQVDNGEVFINVDELHQNNNNDYVNLRNRNQHR